MIGREVLARRAVANQRIVFLSRRYTDSKLTDTANIKYYKERGFLLKAGIVREGLFIWTESFLLDLYS